MLANLRQMSNYRCRVHTRSVAIGISEGALCAGPRESARVVCYPVS